MFKLILNTDELKELQHIAFTEGLTWPNGSNTIQTPIGNAHYTFLDNEYIWTESSMSYDESEEHKEITLDEYKTYIDSKIKVIVEKPKPKKITKKKKLPTRDYIDYTRSDLINELISGKLLQGKSFSKTCYIQYVENSKTSPFLFCDGDYRQPMSESVWNVKEYREYVAPTKLKLSEIEEMLGYEIELIDE